MSEDTLVMQLKSAGSHKWWQSKDAAVCFCKIFYKITFEMKREYFIVVSNFLISAPLNKRRIEGAKS